MTTKWFAALMVVISAPVDADPLGLIDYDRLFAENADAVETADADRDLLQVGDIAILRGNEDDVTFMGLDQSGHGAVGCFVSVLASLESALLACEVTLPADQQAISDDYRARALAFYAENAFPPADLAEVTRRYDALVASEIDLARPFCSDPSIVTDFSDRLFVADTNDEIDGMMSIPRLPVANPCL